MTSIETKILQVKDSNILKETILELLFQNLPKEKLDELKVSLYSVYHHLYYLAKCQVAQTASEPLGQIFNLMKDLDEQSCEHMRNIHCLDFALVINN